MTADVDIVRGLLEESEREAVGFDAKAQWAWATGADQLAQEMNDASVLHQERVRVLTDLLAQLDPVRVDLEVRPAEPDGPPRPALRLVASKPGKTA